MSCQDTQSLIHAYLDGELDLVRSMEIERHLSDCAACAVVHQRALSLKSLVHGGSLYFKAPAGLAKKIQSSLSEIPGPAAKSRFAPAELRHSNQTQWKLSWSWIGAAVLAVALIVVLVLRPSRPSQNDLLAQEVVSSHIRSLLPNHLTDIASSDQHSVKPWFNGRLDFSPPVLDLSPQGFPLVGGRLDYLGDRTVAALVYQRRKHLINVFIWSGSPSGSNVGPPEKAPTQHGFNLFHWTKSGMVFWAVSDLNAQELEEFIQLLRSTP